MGLRRARVELTLYSFDQLCGYVPDSIRTDLATATSPEFISLNESESTVIVATETASPLTVLRSTVDSFWTPFWALITPGLARGRRERVLLLHRP